MARLVANHGPDGLETPRSLSYHLAYWHKECPACSCTEVTEETFVQWTEFHSKLPHPGPHPHVHEFAKI